MSGAPPWFGWPPQTDEVGAVDSVFARTGDVVAEDGDYDSDLITNTSGVAGASVTDALDALDAAIPSVPVASVFARTGAVAAVSGDYNSDQVTNSSGVSGSSVSDALDALESAIPSVPVASVFGRTGAVAAASGDYDTDQVDNASAVPGSSASDALDSLASTINALTSDNIGNDSSVAGGNVSDALDALLGAITPFYGAYGSRPAAGHAGRIATLNDTPIAQWVDTGSVWAPLIHGQVLGVEPPLLNTFTSFNLSSSVGSQLNGAIKFAAQSDASVALRGYTVANSANTAYAEACFQFEPLAEITNNRYLEALLIMRESATAKAWVLGLICDLGVTTDNFALRTYIESSLWTSNTARSFANPMVYLALDPNAPLFLRVRRDASNVYADASRDRQTWVQLASRSVATTFTTGQDQVGICGMGVNVAGAWKLTHFVSGS